MVTSWEVLVLPLYFTFFSFLRCFSSFLFPTKSQSTAYTTPTNSYYGFFGPKPSTSLRSPASSQVLKLAHVFPSVETYTCCRSHIYIDRATLDRCDHTSTNTPDPIITPQLSVLGRE
ncbi:hypothetical protein V8G54_034823 [Vigna mungo]|uniref:Uncharacterized protein n=1 Tax=Vigna mungo TaxID=3915 RepID=A0AAQ3MFD3_VIGMU